jgi:hypothetical protein
MLEDISIDLEMSLPTKEEAYQLFDTFNTDAGKDRFYIEKDEFENFKARVLEMLRATIEK